MQTQISFCCPLVTKVGFIIDYIVSIKYIFYGFISIATQSEDKYKGKTSASFFIYLQQFRVDE